MGEESALAAREPVDQEGEVPRPRAAEHHREVIPNIGLELPRGREADLVLDLPRDIVGIVAAGVAHPQHQVSLVDGERDAVADRGILGSEVEEGAGDRAAIPTKPTREGAGIEIAIGPDQLGRRRHRIHRPRLELRDVAPLGGDLGVEVLRFVVGPGAARRPQLGPRNVGILRLDDRHVARDAREVHQVGAHARRRIGAPVEIARIPRVGHPTAAAAREPEQLVELGLARDDADPHVVAVVVLAVDLRHALDLIAAALGPRRRIHRRGRGHAIAAPRDEREGEGRAAQCVIVAILAVAQDRLDLAQREDVICGKREEHSLDQILPTLR